jgi:hypothetical protein
LRFFRLLTSITLFPIALALIGAFYFLFFVFLDPFRIVTVRYFVCQSLDGITVMVNAICCGIGCCWVGGTSWTLFVRELSSRYSHLSATQSPVES